TSLHESVSKTDGRSGCSTAASGRSGSPARPRKARSDPGDAHVQGLDRHRWVEQRALLRVAEQTRAVDGAGRIERERLVGQLRGERLQILARLAHTAFARRPGIIQKPAEARGEE